MEVVHVTIKNGATLESTQAVAIDPYKIVWLRKYGANDLARILYCRNTDRREPCDDMILTETYAAIAAILSGLTLSWFNEYTVYTEFVEGHGIGNWTLQEQQTFNDFFIEEIALSNEHVNPIQIRYNDVLTEVACLRYCEGAFKRKKVYIEAEDFPGTTTTSTTAAPETTTTTTAAFAGLCYDVTLFGTQTTWSILRCGESEWEEYSLETQLVTLCLADLPVLLTGTGMYEVGDECSTTTTEAATTTTEEPSTTTTAEEATTTTTPQ